MRSFSILLQESTVAGGDDRLWLANFMKGRVKDQYLQALTQATNAIEAQTIRNAEFAGVKDRLKDGAESAWNTLRDLHWTELRPEIDSNSAILWDLYSYSNITQLNKFMNAWKPYQTRFPDLWRAVKTIESLGSLITTLKPMTVAGRAPSTTPVDPEKIKPLPSGQSLALAAKFFTEAVDSFKGKYEDSLRMMSQKDMAVLKTIATKDMLVKATGSVKALASLVVMIKDGQVMLKQNAEELIDREINDSVASVVHNFVSKNAGKVAIVMQKKGEPTSHKILYSRVNAGIIENSMEFKFGDGSSFEIVTSIVTKMSPSGKWFNQFPTRFTNVKMADGSRMSQPSELKVAKEF